MNNLVRVCFGGTLCNSYFIRIVTALMLTSLACTFLLRLSNCSKGGIGGGKGHQTLHDQETTRKITISLFHTQYVNMVVSYKPTSSNNRCLRDFFDGIFSEDKLSSEESCNVEYLSMYNHVFRTLASSSTSIINNNTHNI